MEKYRCFTSHDATFRATSPDINIDGLLSAGFRVNDVLELLTGEYQRDWSKAKDLTVLDLGSGSSNVHHLSFFGVTISEQPYFCRLMGANGATVFGIDQYPGFEEDAELYTHITGDLIEVIANGTLPRLPEIQGIQFDVVHSHRFAATGIHLTPDLDRELYDAKYHISDFRQGMKDQSAQVLREGGIALFENKAFKKENGLLVPVPWRRDKMDY